jgi:nicotinate-nucleotide adenylyltransferase
LTADRGVGLLGGTFDPIHVGHLAIAEDVLEQLGLERIAFLPAGQPQLRSRAPAASAADRAAMVELAVAGNPAFSVDRQEVDRPGPTFAVDTLEALHAGDASAADPWFILSAEALLGLPRWKSPERVLALARLAVVPRSGTPSPDRAWVESAFPGFGDRVAFVDGPLLDVSGTAVRARIRAGRSIRYLVPDAVRDYIKDHDLYRT